MSVIQLFTCDCNNVQLHMNGFLLSKDASPNVIAEKDMLIESLGEYLASKLTEHSLEIYEARVEAVVKFVSFTVSRAIFDRDRITAHICLLCNCATHFTIGHEKYAFPHYMKKSNDDIKQLLMNADFCAEFGVIVNEDAPTPRFSKSIRDAVLESNTLTEDSKKLDTVYEKSIKARKSAMNQKIRAFIVEEQTKMEEYTRAMKRIRRILSRQLHSLKSRHIYEPLHTRSGNISDESEEMFKTDEQSIFQQGFDEDECVRADESVDNDSGISSMLSSHDIESKDFDWNDYEHELARSFRATSMLLQHTDEKLVGTRPRPRIQRFYNH